MMNDRYQIHKRIHSLAVDEVVREIFGDVQPIKKRLQICMQLYIIEAVSFVVNHLITKAGVY